MEQLEFNFDKIQPLSEIVDESFPDLNKEQKEELVLKLLEPAG